MGDFINAIISFLGSIVQIVISAFSNNKKVFWAVLIFFVIIGTVIISMPIIPTFVKHPEQNIPVNSTLKPTEYDNEPKPDYDFINIISAYVQIKNKYGTLYYDNTKRDFGYGCDDKIESMYIFETGLEPQYMYIKDLLPYKVTINIYDRENVEEVNYICLDDGSIFNLSEMKRADPYLLYRDIDEMIEITWPGDSIQECEEINSVKFEHKLFYSSMYIYEDRDYKKVELIPGKYKIEYRDGTIQTVEFEEDTHYDFNERCPLKPLN